MTRPVSSLSLEGWRADLRTPRPLRCVSCADAQRILGDHGPLGMRASLIAALHADGDYRLLHRLEPRTKYADAEGAATFTALYVDVETTGLDVTQDRIIQLALIPFTFTADGRVCDVRASESWYEDPGVPISAAITALTGIRQEDVLGQRIDEDRVYVQLAETALVIAHNAAFDRPFLERRFPAFAAQPWGCSMADVPWKESGLPSTRLEFLAERQTGVFYEAHRADMDCRAGVHLLASTLPAGHTAMSALLAAVRAQTVRVWALASPFATKGLLKERGYRWSGGEDGQPKSWYRDVGDADLAVEREWLAAHVYPRGSAAAARAQRFGTKTRYSSRVADIALSAFD